MELKVLTITVWEAPGGDRFKVFAGEQDVSNHFAVRMGSLPDGRTVLVVEETPNDDTTSKDNDR